MSYNETINNCYENALEELLSKLSEEDKYRCIAGIPGPILKMRSGTLPINTSASSVRNKLISLFNLKRSKLESYTKDIYNEYRINKILPKYKNITFDSKSRNILLKSYLKSFLHKLTKKSIDINKSDRIKEIRLMIQNQKVSIAYPDELVSIGLLWEIFVEETYYIKEKVDCIYDLGANIGLSAIYFHLLNPLCEIVCVEPMLENVELLKRNLQLNNIHAKVLNAAIGTKNEEKTLFFSDQSHALPSLYTKQKNSRQIKVIPLNEIVTARKYGLKIDIEGGEESLVEFESIIKNATFIVGELHYSKDIAKNDRIDKFFNIIEENFIVEKGRPSVYFVGKDVELCVCYKAIQKHK